MNFWNLAEETMSSACRMLSVQRLTGTSGKHRVMCCDQFDFINGTRSGDRKEGELRLSFCV